MAWWGPVLSFFTGGGKTAENVVDGVMSAGDKLFYTEEEKAEANKKGFELYIEYMKASAPFNVARRYIAVGVTYLWITNVVMTAVLHLIGLTDDAKFLLKILTDIVNYPFMLIMGFYFLKRLDFGGKKKDNG